MSALATRCLLLALLAGASASAVAWPFGSPVCSVRGLPLREMSDVLASPPPSGWALVADEAVFYPGEPVAVAVVNPEASARVRGVLLWSERSPQVGAGAFDLPASGAFQYVPPGPGVSCGRWAVTHTNAGVKGQDELVFTWHPPVEGAAVLRAFLIADCEGPASCVAHQVLTPLLVLEAGVLRDGFEAP